MKADTHPCPECGVWYCVIWDNDGISKPEFCPFCGWDSVDGEESDGSDG